MKRMYRLRERLAGMHYLNYWIVLLLDVIASVICSYLAAVTARYLTSGFDELTVLRFTLLSIPVSALSFYLFRIYKNIIRHSTLRELWKLLAASAVKTVLLVCCACIWSDLNRKQLFLAGSMDLLLTAVVLICMRVGMVLTYDVLVSKIAKGGTRLLIYGVDDASVALETRLRNGSPYQVIGFYNFGKAYKSYRLADLPVYYFNNEEDFVHVVSRHNVEGILFPDNDSVRAEKERLIRYCEAHQVKMLIAPPVDEVGKGRSAGEAIRAIKIEDLLGREEIKVNEAEIIANFKGRTVMVTGAAGSIGSELCRQLAGFGVGRLILFDAAETPMHNIRLELEERFPNLDFVPIIGDVRLKQRLRMAFERYRPSEVFHAAAYKHVPLMEENPCEAVFVNAVGTRHVADLCVEFGVEKMVMISTDKAVNPTNVMGASKRLAEIYVQSLGVAIAEGRKKGRTRFVTTRFGNVLGSNGSVIPRFMEQIRHGGPVTVTHPDITRFFMTIPEACRLVMEAAMISEGNEIMVFEMGESTRIADLAKRMIRLAGYVPDVDIQIKYTGLRPGEKLYEEVLSTQENTIPTTHQKIKIAKVRKYEYAAIEPAFREFVRLSLIVDVHGTVRLMKELVPEFVSNNSRFEEIDRELEREGIR